MRIYSTFAVQNIIHSRVTPQQTQNDVLYWKRCEIIKIRKTLVAIYPIFIAAELQAKLHFYYS